MPLLSDSFQASAKHGFRIIYQLGLGWAPEQAVFLQPRITRKGLAVS
jgi:hypothetical protein